MKPADFGILAACADAGINPADYPQIQAFNAETAKSAGLGRLAAGLAHDVLVQAGDGGGLVTHIYGELTKVAHWTEFHAELVAPVFRALDTVMTELGQEKSAAEGGGGVPLVGSLPEAAKLMLGGGVAGGSAIGMLHWLLNRDATANDAASESLMTRTDYYRRLRDEIKGELRNSAPPQLRRALRQQTAEAVL